LRKLFSLLTAVLGMIACIAMGSVAAGLLYDELEEHHPILAALLVVAALLATTGTLFFLFRFLKQIAPKR
jgi:TRAP-type C4-dicarboxylate transport system permease small subunit